MKHIYATRQNKFVKSNMSPAQNQSETMVAHSGKRKVDDAMRENGGSDIDSLTVKELLNGASKRQKVTEDAAPLPETIETQVVVVESFDEDDEMNEFIRDMKEHRIDAIANTLMTKAALNLSQEDVTAMYKSQMEVEWFVYKLRTIIYMDKVECTAFLKDLKGTEDRVCDVDDVRLSLMFRVTMLVNQCYLMSAKLDAGEFSRESVPREVLGVIPKGEMSFANVKQVMKQTVRLFRELKTLCGWKTPFMDELATPVETIRKRVEKKLRMSQKYDKLNHSNGARKLKC